MFKLFQQCEDRAKNSLWALSLKQGTRFIIQSFIVKYLLEKTSDTLASISEKKQDIRREKKVKAKKYILEEVKIAVALQNFGPSAVIDVGNICRCRLQAMTTRHSRWWKRLVHWVAESRDGSGADTVLTVTSRSEPAPEFCDALVRGL